MSLTHAILLFIGGPLVIIGLCYALAVLMTRKTSSAGRYKLGNRWEHAPLWFVGHPRDGVSTHPHTQIEPTHPNTTPATMVGGASGTW